MTEIDIVLLIRYYEFNYSINICAYMSYYWWFRLVRYNNKIWSLTFNYDNKDNSHSPILLRISN